MKFEIFEKEPFVAKYKSLTPCGPFCKAIRIDGKPEITLSLYLNSLLGKIIKHLTNLHKVGEDSLADYKIYVGCSS